MRTALLLPLALAAAAAGCGTTSGGRQETAYQVPARDLTLQEPDVPSVEVASPVELARTPAHQASHRARRARRSEPQPRHETAGAGETPAAAAPAPAPAALEAAPVATAAAEPADPHALAPGQTVTIIPASNGGPTTDAAPAERLRPEGGRGVTTMHPGGHGGGGCKPRGGGGRRTGAGAFRLTL